MRRGTLLAAVSLAALPCVSVAAANASAAESPVSHSAHTRTPIKHLVVIFDENVSFDHYFGTYPHATNPLGEPTFTAKPGTPSVNGLASAALLQRNSNANQPQRLDRSQAVTCDQDHGYTAEQKAADSGLMDKFVQNTDSGNCTSNGSEYYRPGLVMDYYDGNTVTALWNYAQRFAMSDNSYDTTFGPSTPGALNLVSGQTHGVISMDPKTGQQTTTPDPYTVADPNAQGVGTVINDPDPAYDDCSNPDYAHAAMQGTNIGDLLNAKKVTWGWFQGGFRPTSRSGDGAAVCGAAHANVAGASTADYIPHHEPFQYYKSTANPHHLPPSSVAMIGKTDQANHQYDLTDFWKAADSGHMAAVSFLKAAGYQDGHAGYSDPIDEQHFLVSTLNRLQRLPDWKHTAVVIAYDDSDGWYDHVSSPIVNMSATSHDALTGAGSCGNPTTQTQLGGYSDRCGYGPRLPLLVLSPYARSNYVDHTITDQSSILKFIEDNWNTGRIGDGSFDSIAGPLTGMFNFHHPDMSRLFLNSNGEARHRH